MTGIGIDTGGTCTDAVVYDIDNKQVLARAKSQTTHEKLEIGIAESLKKLPRNMIEAASYISLSTTLATNACVENKGGRVCLIFIGVDEKTVYESYEKYGFDGTDFMRFINADAYHDIEPDWNELDKMLPEIFENYDSIAISQMQARENNGAYEKKARKRILEQRDITVVCAYEMFRDFNAIKRGAGALLNARLIPVIENFFRAVKNVLKDENIDIPFVIMRSDGSLVSEEYSRLYPIETLLCGPTASVKGGLELMQADDSVVIDMGGTTSDIALIKNSEPVINSSGVKVGNWQTFVRGIDIDTFALGGDSHVRHLNKDIYLNSRRVLPISALAKNHPYIVEELESLCMDMYGSAIDKYEHFLLMKDISDVRQHYNEQELKVCDTLSDGPLSVRKLAEAIGTDPYMLRLDRLEDEGVILRSGLTPTDAMVLKGDRADLRENLTDEEYKSTPYFKAAKLAVSYISKCTGLDEKEIPERIYYLVKEKLYVNLVRILKNDSRKAPALDNEGNVLDAFAREAFLREMADIYKDKPFGGILSKDNKSGFYGCEFKTGASLMGVGAPVHVFLPDVAKALHTDYVLSEYSGVSNALGAMLGDVCAIETAYIKVVHLIGNGDEEGEQFFVLNDTKEEFEELEDALKRAGEIAEKRAEEKAKLCGATEIYELTTKNNIKRGSTNLGGILLEAEVTATARGRF